jgi:hypothetical protein
MILEDRGREPPSRKAAKRLRWWLGFSVFGGLGGLAALLSVFGGLA